MEEKKSIEIQVKNLSTPFNLQKRELLLRFLVDYLKSEKDVAETVIDFYLDELVN